jgi:hypothetical protein
MHSLSIWQYTCEQMGKDENFDKATFTKGGQEISAYYDYDSKLVVLLCIKPLPTCQLSTENH